MQAVEGNMQKRARKACVECRQQKARCDAYLTPGEPCSRCRKVNLECVISDPFKREHKRKKLSELEQETAILREQLKFSSAHVLESSTSPDTIGALNHSPITNTQGSRTHIPLVNTPIPGSLLSESTASSFTAPLGAPISDLLGEVTLPRVLDDVRFEGPLIDEIFQLYFSGHAKSLPILDNSKSPNSYYAESPVLFWAIIGVGCRIHRDESILQKIAPSIINMFSNSLRGKISQSRIPVIKASLLFLAWPFPRESHDTDITFPFAGALIHMALQIGLHIPAATQDFSRVVIKLTDEDITRRSELWAHTVILYQRSSTTIGNYPTSVFDRIQEQDGSLYGRIAPTLKFQFQLHRLERRCCAAVQELNLRKLSMEHEKTLDILVRVFESLVKDLAAQAETEVDKLFYCVTRHMIAVFHFYKNSLATDVLASTRIFSSACAVIEQLSYIDKNGPIDLRTAPMYYIYSLMVATTSLLRLMKSSFYKYVESEHAKNTLLLGLEIVKKLSKGNNQLATKLNLIITQLWNSERAFKNSDGSEFINLRIRTRMMMSPLYDTVWWWREEFGGQAGAYQPAKEEEQLNTGPAAPKDYITSDALPMDSSSLWFGFMEPFYFPNDQTLAEFDWPLDTSGPLSNGLGPDWNS